LPEIAMADSELLWLFNPLKIPTRVGGGEVIARQKISLANHYGFVMMRPIYDKNVTFLWNWQALVGPVDRMCMFDICAG
jgi:hypothetical protein